MKTLCSLFVFAAALVIAPVAKADSITLESHVGNQFTYDLTIDSSPTYFFLDGFELSALDGVTNAVLSGPLANEFAVNFTQHTVDVYTLFEKESSRQIPFSLGTLTITSTAPAGPVNYSILDSNGYSSGSVIGPDAPAPSPVPEPSSLLMLGTGLLTTAGAVRRKFFN